MRSSGVLLFALLVLPVAVPATGADRQTTAAANRWIAYDCARNAWLGVKFAGPNLIGNQAFHNSLGLVYDPNRRLVWVLGQHSEVWVLRFDSKSADLQPLR